MSAGFAYNRPTEDQIAAAMLDTGADYENAKRSLELTAALAAVDTMADMADAKVILKAIIRRLGSA